jgi:hypothetical protein
MCSRQQEKRQSDQEDPHKADRNGVSSITEDFLPVRIITPSQAF